MGIKIYTTSTCHWCNVAKDYFKERDIEFEEYNVEEDEERAKEMVQISKQRGVPVIDVNGTVIIGFNKEAIEDIMNNDI